MVIDFPRASGDEPLMWVPRTTPARIFPARVGMNRSRRFRLGLFPDFPRASGDEPMPWRVMILRTLFSPREWG